MDYCRSFGQMGVCPVCRFIARVSPNSESSITVQCDRCGDFDLLDSAEELIGNHPLPLDRMKLSEALRDMCAITDYERPLIDAITASVLIAFAET